MADQCETDEIVAVAFVTCGDHTLRIGVDENTDTDINMIRLLISYLFQCAATVGNNHSHSIN